MPGVDNPQEYVDLDLAKLPTDPRVTCRMGPPGSIQQRVWLRPANSSNVKVPNAGHLVSQPRSVCPAS